MSKTLPPKINLREGREKKEGETGEEGREEEEGKQPFNGDRRGKSLRFNGIKTAQLVQGARAASGNVRGCFQGPGSVFPSPPPAAPGIREGSAQSFGDLMCERCESQS